MKIKISGFDFLMSGKTMSMNVFDILMVIAVGSMAGTGIGLIIGFVAKKQGNPASIMSGEDCIQNFALIAGGSFVSVVGLGWIFLT